MAVLFNVVLAIVNADISPISSGEVVAAEMLVVGLAHYVAFARYRPEMAPWYILLFFLMGLALVRGLLIGVFEPKYVRDVMIIPTFVLLGMTAESKWLNRATVIIQAIVLVGMLVEATNTELWAKFLDVRGYYINTRGLTLDNFWNDESDLFVSAIRPGDRFIALFDMPRMSSIFLEPVSLGNWCILITAYICARFKTISLRSRLFLIGANAALLIGCDGRLAIVASGIIVVLSLVLWRGAARYFAMLSLPTILLVALALVQVGGLHSGQDDFPGRVAYTAEIIWDLTVPDWLGISNNEELLIRSVDSGIVYLLITQSVIGALMLWGMITRSRSDDSSERTRFVMGASVYLSLTMIVSYSFLTIKTAAFLWFVYGALSLRKDPIESAV